VWRGGEEIRFHSNTKSTDIEKVFDETWIYRSGIIGSGVRPLLDSVFEVGWILQPTFLLSPLSQPLPHLSTVNRMIYLLLISNHRYHLQSSL